jgi:uncharacterized membrane protein YgdD (TMEM256/DUF423 family)
MAGRKVKGLMDTLFNSRTILALVGISGALVVVLGAYGAHELNGSLESGLLITFQKGVRYQTVHTLALFGVAAFLIHYPESRGLKIAALAFCLGIILFSGSLYLIVFMGVKSLGLLTPFGGLAFILGWLSLAWTSCWELPLSRK